jgi:hypothetical protein
MTLKEWMSVNGFSDAAFAGLLSELVKRKIKPQSVCQWRNGTMPRWDVGDAIQRLTGGKVTPSGFARKETLPSP